MMDLIEDVGGRGFELTAFATATKSYTLRRKGIGAPSVSTRLPRHVARRRNSTA